MAQAQRVEAKKLVEGRTFLVEQLHVALRAEEPQDLDVLKRLCAQAPQLVRVELDVVIRIDDLVGTAEGEPVRRYEDRDTRWLQDPSHLGHRPIRVGHVLE